MILGVQRNNNSTDFESLVCVCAKEVDVSQDVQQWEALTDSKKHFISHVPAFLRQR
ncbi:putative oxidoreductase [Rosa chinensis]|uniref:Putative oxidoreductase n=1 Tax=Rosa chinensis TaxID=74649 RepID=A0A2P6Q4D3_ROSCH|nr:putative oxidoreductase [Rosa chinensis]